MRPLISETTAPAGRQSRAVLAGSLVPGTGRESESQSEHQEHDDRSGLGDEAGWATEGQWPGKASRERRSEPRSRQTRWALPEWSARAGRAGPGQRSGGLALRVQP